MPQNIAKFLLSYLVLEIIFWLKQDAVLQNHFHFVFFSNCHENLVFVLLTLSQFYDQT